VTGDPNRPSGSGLPKRRRGESLRAARTAASPSAPAPGHEYRAGPQPPAATPGPGWPASPPGVAGSGGATAGPAAHAPPAWPGAPAVPPGHGVPHPPAPQPIPAFGPAPAPQPIPAFGPGAPPPGREPYGGATPAGPPGTPPGAAPLTLPPEPPPVPPAGPTPAARRTKEARRSGRRRILNAVLGTVLAAAAVGLQTTVPSADDRDDPITSSGTVGEDVRTSLFTLRVERVSLARRFKKENSDPIPAFPGHVYLIIAVDATATKRALRLQSAHLETPDGKTFESSDQITSPELLKNKWVQPMMWTKGLIVFEVPPSALPGASVVVQEQAFSLYQDKYVPEAAIDLGLDAAATRSVQDVAEVRTT